MTESDKKYYENVEKFRQKHAMAISKAAFRGERSVEWHKSNNLTRNTLPSAPTAVNPNDNKEE